MEEQNNTQFFGMLFKEEINFAKTITGQYEDIAMQNSCCRCNRHDMGFERAVGYRDRCSFNNHAGTIYRNFFEN